MNPIFTLISNTLFCFILFCNRIFWCILFLKSLFVTNIASVLFLFYFVSCHKACGIPAPRPGIEPSPPEWEGKVLITEPPRKFPTACFKVTKLIMWFVNLHLFCEICLKSFGIVHLAVFGRYQCINKYTHETVAAAAVKLLQSRPTLCEPIDSSPPGSAVLMT